MESDCSTPLDDKTTEVGLEDNKEIEKSPVTYRQKFLQTFWTFTTIFGLVSTPLANYLELDNRIRNPKYFFRG